MTFSALDAGRHPARAERHVQRAVRVEPREVRRGAAGVAGRDDLAVGLDERLALVDGRRGGAGHVRGDRRQRYARLATDSRRVPAGRVERAVRVDPDDRPRLDRARSRLGAVRSLDGLDDDLAVGLDAHAVARVGVAGRARGRRRERARRSCRRAGCRPCRRSGRDRRRARGGRRTRRGRGSRACRGWCRGPAASRTGRRRRPCRPPASRGRASSPRSRRRAEARRC